MSSEAAQRVVTGANGFVGARICQALAESGGEVRAVVRRAGTAPERPGITEVVGDFTDPEFAAAVLDGADTVISTVHPMGSDRATQHHVGVAGTFALATAAVRAGVERFIHISTAAVYDRSPGVGDVDEASALVGDGANDYAITKRDADAALADAEGLTRVILRPPAILGPGPSSTWNTLRPEAMRHDQSARHAIADQTFAWVHVDDLARFAAAIATGTIAEGADPAAGPVTGAWIPVNVVAEPATLRDYFATVTGALGVEPLWDDGPGWTGRLLAERAHGWGWSPAVGLEQALAEIAGGLDG